MGYSKEAILLAVVPKVPAVLSLLGSSCIVHSVLVSSVKRQSLYHRIMFGMSCSDILASTIYFLGTWLIPRGTVGQYGPVFGAVGNEATCNLSGFFTQFAVCSPLYNGALSLYYLLMIKFGWKDDRIGKIEMLLHGIPVTFASATAITGIALQLYGSVEWLCWINPDPPQPNFRIYQWTFLFVPLWICFFFVSIVMLILWRTMRELERAMERYDINGWHSNVGSKRSKEVALQGILYVAAFYITWFFPSLQRVIELVANKNYFVLQMFDTALLPLQGLFNVMIYLRPRIQRYHRNNPDMRWWRVLWNDTRRASAVFDTSSRVRARRSSTEIDILSAVAALETELGDSTGRSTEEQTGVVKDDEEIITS